MRFIRREKKCPNEFTPHKKEGKGQISGAASLSRAFYGSAEMNNKLGGANDKATRKKMPPPPMMWEAENTLSRKNSIARPDGELYE